MRSTLQRLVGPITPGTLVILGVLTFFFILRLVGSFTRLFDTMDWFALTGPGFWKGRVWTMVTYALVPASILELLFNWTFIVFIGCYLERVWSKGQLWVVSTLSIIVVGSVKVLLFPSNPGILVGTAPVVFGLLAAWGWVFAHERVLFWFMWEMSIRQAAILFIGISYVVMAFSCTGFLDATIMACGALGGLGYVWVHQNLVRAQPSRTVTSNRIGRLEL